MPATFNSHRPVIVIVDDESHILKTIQRMTKNLPAECYFFNDSKDALDWIEQNYADIVISDYNMPHINGMELLARVSELIPESIRLVITGYADPGILQEAINQAHVWGFIEKPWDNAKFMAKIESAIAHREIIRNRLNELFSELEKSASQADASNRLKSEFLAMMSHEIRTPMTTVQGSLNLLTETNLSEKQQQLVSHASDAGNAMLRLLGDILDFSKIESGHHRMSVKEIDLAGLLTNVVDDYLPIAQRKNLQIHCAIDDSANNSLFTDRMFVRQILANLVDNAIKFTNEGEVKISIEAQPADLFKITVSDTGIGIAQDNEADIFNKFTQIMHSYNRPYEGSGLGLAICKRLVEKLGGEIGYESSPKGGSQFWFTLKDHLNAFDEVGEHDFQESIQFKSPVNNYEPSETDLEMLRHKKILIVEDSSANQLIIKSMLASTGIDVHLASDGVDAIEKVESLEFDIILMDLSMPRMDGATASRHIREQLKLLNLPIVALTANVEMVDIKHCLLSGMTDYVFKPVSKEHLIKSISYYLNRDVNQSAKATLVENDKSEESNGHWLEQAALKQLAADTSEETMSKIISMYIKEMTNRTETLQMLLKDTLDLEEIGKEAHAIKSSSATLGAQKASDLAKDLETCCKEESTELIQQLTEQLLSALGHSTRALSEYIDR